MSDIIEAAAKVLFEDSGRKWADAEEWERDMERATAAVLHKAGLLATGEEWSAAYVGVGPDGTRAVNLIGTEGSRAHAEATRDDCARDDPDTRFFLVRRGYTDWQEATE